MLADVAEMTADGSSLSTSTNPTVATAVAGNHPGYKLSYASQTTNCIAWDAPANTIDAGYSALSARSDEKSVQELFSVNTKTNNEKVFETPSAGGAAATSYMVTWEEAASYNIGDVRYTNNHAKVMTSSVAASAGTCNHIKLKHIGINSITHSHFHTNSHIIKPIKTVRYITRFIAPRRL